MKTLLTVDQRHLLYKDDSGDEFVLTEFCEVFRASKNCLSVIFWKRTTPGLLLDILFDIHTTDDKLTCATIKTTDLHRILKLSKLKKRPHIRGRFIRNLEDKLGHNIMPYRPTEFKIKGDGYAKRILNLAKGRS